VFESGTVDGIAVLQDRLGRLSEAELGALLARRADVLAGVPPRDLRELAQRLWHPHSLVTALRDTSLPCLQLAEAAAALGAGCGRAALAELLSGDGPEHRRTVDRVVDALIANAVIAADGPDRLVLPDALAQIFPSPLGLDEPLAVLLRERSVEAMRRVQSALGVERRKNRADTVLALLTYFADPERVRALVARAPEEVAQYLIRLARAPEDDEDGYNAHRYQMRQAARTWAAERGLLIGDPWGWDLRMPAEVTLALRGPGYRAPFTPYRPEAVTRPIDRVRIERDSAAAAMTFADHLVTVLDHLARTPVPALKAGGVGAREIGKLAKAAKADDVAVRLALELADAMSLLARAGEVVVVSDQFSAWRDLEPARRFAAALAAWWQLGATPTETRDVDGKVVRALARPGDCSGCRAARVALLDALAELQGASSCADVARVALWQRPLVDIAAQDESAPLATVWREGELLGVIADGSLSDLGHALREGTADDVIKRAADLLPPSTDRATFGSDLTVYVVGAPSTQVSRLLDSCADRESRGSATTWRLRPASIRRALDEGTSGDVLTAALAEIATGRLPQPLCYLIADVARRHGHLRLSSATTCITSDDVALLAQLAADRKLAKYGLRLLAPTVLTGEAPLATLLDALRAAGYFPVADGADRSGEHAPRRPTALPKRPRSMADRNKPAPLLPDPHSAAAALLRGPAGKDGSDPVSLTEELLVTVARSLSIAEIRQLAHAIDTKSRVCIDYVSATGGATRRIIDQPELVGSTLFAWCELRADDRVFTVSRIQSVAAV
jgi:hypothetical protein